MGHRKQTNEEYADYYRVIEPLLQSGWTSYIDIELAILNDSILSEKYFKTPDGKNQTIRFFANLYEGMERYVKLNEALNAKLRRIKDDMCRKQLQMQYHTDFRTTKQLFIREDKIKYTFSDDELKVFKLRPETMQFIGFIKEIKKTKKNSPDIKKIGTTYGFKSLNEEIARSLRSKSFLQVFRYVDSCYSLISDIEKKDTKGNLINIDRTAQLLFNSDYKRPEYPPEVTGHVSLVEGSLNNIIEAIQVLEKTIQNGRKEIRENEEKREKGWVKKNKDIWDIITSAGNTRKELLKELELKILELKQKKIDISGDIEASHIHRLNHPEPYYIPSDITSIIISYDDYCENIVRDDSYASFSKNMKELALLLKKKDIEEKDLYSIRDLCFAAVMSSGIVLKQKPNAFSPVNNFEILEDAIDTLLWYIGDLSYAYKIIEALIYFRSKPNIDISEIVDPINGLISREKKYFALLDRTTGLTEKCRKFINNIDRSVPQNHIKLFAIGVLLSEIENNYTDSYNILDLVHNSAIFEELEKNNGVRILFFHWAFEKYRRELTLRIKDENIEGFSRILVTDLRVLLSLFCYGETFGALGFAEREEIMDDIKNITSIITGSPNDFISEKMLILLDVVKYATSPNQIVFQKIRTIVDSKKETIQIINNAKAKRLNSNEMQLLYYCIALKMIDTISVNIQYDRKRTEKTILSAFNWLKKNIIDKIDERKWGGEKESLKYYFEAKIVFAFKINFRKEEFQYNYQDW